MTLVRLLLVLVVMASAAAPVAAGDEQDCFQGQDPEMRIRGCTEIIERTPGEATGYHNRAVAYSLAGYYEDAVADYTKVIEIAPDNASAYANRSRAYESLGDYAQAAADSTRAQELMAKAIAQPTIVTRKGQFLQSETQAEKSPPTATPTRNPKPPLKTAPAVKTEAALKTEPLPKADPPLKAVVVLQPEPAPKANNGVAAEGSPTLLSWFNAGGGKKDPPAKTDAAPKADPVPYYSTTRGAPPGTLLAWLNQLNGKKAKP